MIIFQDCQDCNGSGKANGGKCRSCDGHGFTSRITRWWTETE